MKTIVKGVKKEKQIMSVNIDGIDVWGCIDERITNKSAGSMKQWIVRSEETRLS